MNIMVISDQILDGHSISLIIRHHCKGMRLLGQYSLFSFPNAASLDLQPNIVFFAPELDSEDDFDLVRLVKDKIVPARLIVIIHEESTRIKFNILKNGADYCISRDSSSTDIAELLNRIKILNNSIQDEDSVSDITINSLINRTVSAVKNMKNQNTECELLWNAIEKESKSDKSNAEQSLLKFASSIVESKHYGNDESLTEFYMEFTRSISFSDDIKTWKAAFNIFNEKCCGYFNRFSADSGFNKIMQIKRFMEENIAQQLSLKSIAEQFFMSTAYLSRLFSEKADITFSDYLYNLRLARAKTLLMSTDLTIQEIAERTGYDDISSFSRFFKKKVGVTAVKFRQANTKKNNSKENILTYQDNDMGPCVYNDSAYVCADNFEKRI